MASKVRSMLLHVIHETRYDYAPPVKTAQHMAHLKPLHTASQRLLSHALTISPTPAQRGEAADVYGNTRAFFACSRPRGTGGHRRKRGRHRRSRCCRRDRRALPWEEVRERFRYTEARAYDPASEFVFRVALRAAPRRLRRLRAAQLRARPAACSTPRCDLMLRIYARFRLRRRQPPRSARRRSRRWPCARASARTSRTS